MTEPLLAPLVPADADLKDFAFTPLYRARLFGSSFHARATDAEWRAGVTLWLKSWDQVPAGSLPDDDIDLCRLAELGRDLKSWAKIKVGAMRGWLRCSDGRLYHPVVAEVVLEAWDKRAKASKKGKAGAAKRWGAGNATATPDNGTGIARAMPDDSKGQGQGQGQGQGHKEGEPPQASAAKQPSQDLLDIPKFLDRTRATRLPADWSLTPELRTLAEQTRKFHKLAPCDVDLEAANFKDYWSSKSGKDATKTDWTATWRAWIRKAHSVPQRTATVTGHDAVIESAVAIAEAAAREAREARDG